MGDSVEKSNQETLTSFTKYFEKICPFFLAIGMSYEQFWYDDCWIANAYLKAYRIKKEQLNEQYWLQGMYFYEAILDASPVLRAFSKSGTKPIPYSKEPYPLFKKTDKKEKEKQKEADRLKAIAFFENWAKATAKKFNK